MRVLYISHGGGHEGAPIALINLIKGMLDLGVKVGVTVPQKRGFFFEEMQRLGVTVFCRRGYPSIMSKPNVSGGVLSKFKIYYEYSKTLIGVQRDMLSIIKEFKPDIVHTNTSAIDYALLGCRLTHTPHVWHVRELLDSGCGQDIFPSLKLLRWKLRLPFNHCIATTKAVFEHYNMHKQDIVVYDGVIDSNMPVVCQKGIFTYPYFLCVGYIYKNKGQKEIIEAFVEFCKINNTHHLVFAGKYEVNDFYYLECVQIAKYNQLIDRIHFLGLRTDIYRLMSSATALVIGSYFEGFGFTMVEAMYNGSLVIGRNVGGIKEQFDNGVEQTGEEIGLRYDEYSKLPTLLHDAINGDYDDMVQRAKSVVIRNYTLQISSQRVYDYYKTILINE